MLLHTASSSELTNVAYFCRCRRSSLFCAAIFQIYCNLIPTRLPLALQQVGAGDVIPGDGSAQQDQGLVHIGERLQRAIIAAGTGTGVGSEASGNLGSIAESERVEGSVRITVARV